MDRVGFVAVAMAGLAAVAPPAVAAGLDSLAWMAGSWGGVQGETTIEEHWTTPAGGLMVCMHKDVRRGRAVSFEFLRIVQHLDSLVFIALPRGRNETRFPMKEIAPGRVVFESPDHDFPQRVLYWRGRNGTLNARVEGVVDGRPESEEWAWRRVRLAR